MIRVGLAGRPLVAVVSIVEFTEGPDPDVEQRLADAGVGGVTVGGYARVAGPGVGVA